MALRLSETEVVNEAGKQLIEWLDCKYFGCGQKIQVVENDKDNFTIQIHTSKHCYRITASPENELESDYLGCIVSTRMPRPGENWTRGNDLPDGRFLKETLHCILCSIVFYEAREVVKDIKQTDDCVEEKQLKD